MIEAIYLNDNGQPTEYYHLGDSYYKATLVKEYMTQHDLTLQEICNELIKMQKTQEFQSNNKRRIQ